MKQFAFPQQSQFAGDEGMTLRDFFASQFMEAAYSYASGLPEYDLKAMFGDRTGLRREEIAAALSYRMADAMIARSDHR
jgi:hypothetical protein